SRLALLLRRIEGFEDSSLRIGQGGVIVETDTVNLPEIEMIGAQTAQRLVEHLQGEGGAPAMRADFRHEKDLVAAASKRPPHPLLGLAGVVFPAIVEKPDAGIDGAMNKANGLGDGL